MEGKQFVEISCVIIQFNGFFQLFKVTRFLVGVVVELDQLFADGYVIRYFL